MTPYVSAALMLFVRDGRGRLRTGVLVDTVLRGAVLLDLARSGRLTNSDDEISLDPTPLGYPPADRLAGAMLADPGLSLDEWLTRREPVQAELADYWVAEGRWRPVPARRRPRYEDRLAGQVEPARWRARHIVEGGAQADEVTTCVAVLSHLAGVLDIAANGGDDELFDRCGPAQWLLPMINDWAVERIRRQRAVAAAASAASMTAS